MIIIHIRYIKNIQINNQFCSEELLFLVLNDIKRIIELTKENNDIKTIITFSV